MRLFGCFREFCKNGTWWNDSKICFLSIDILIFKISWESIQRPRILWLKVSKTFVNLRPTAMVAVVVRPVLKVRPRDGKWIFWFERFISFKGYPWLSTFQISFHFNKYLAICKKIFAAKRAPWRHGLDSHRFLLLWVDCVVAVAASGRCQLCCLLRGSSYWRIWCRDDVKRILDNLVTMLYLSCLYWI